MILYDLLFIIFNIIFYDYLFYSGLMSNPFEIPLHCVCLFSMNF